MTAIIVAHDGAAWLPRLLEALGEQTSPVQRVVAVDTGSRDRSGSVLTAQLGHGAVFGMDRSAGYAAAVRRAVQHKAASTPVAQAAAGRGRADRGGEVEWLWLLHDDCAPAADALEQLLRGATETPHAAVLGPKLRDWTDRDVIVEAGLTIDTAGRRVTGVEPREVDQGQHDGDRDALAVCSAGMLVRRDVWERLGGFDPAMLLFGEDIDFCWRVHQAGFRVRVITDAVVYHTRAATRGRRAISVGRRARLLDRRNGLLTLLGNLPAAPMLASLAGNLTLSLLRTLFYLVAKRPEAALDESAAVLGVVGHPLRLGKARRRRAAGRRTAYSALRSDLPPGRSIRRVAELVATLLSRPTADNLAGTHHATDDPTDDDSLLVDSGVLQRLLTRPGVLLLFALIVVTAVAERRILTAGTLGGGALLPAWEGASGLWSQYLQAYHPVGIGSGSAGPPYLAAVAVLATILLGKAWLAVDVLLLGCVPLAGLTAYLSLRRVASSVPVRVWAAASYALLPIAFGAISAGRLGSAVGFVLVPVIGALAGRMFTQPAKLARRAAWATGLTVAVGAAFVPLLWPLTVVGVVLAALALRRWAMAMAANLAIAILTPLVLLLPWLVHLLGHPTRLLLEAGIQQPGLATADLPARSLVLLSPGGPGLPPYWASAALLVAGLAALLTSRRLTLVACGWGAALLGFAAALAASRLTVTPAGGQPMTAWPGVALAVAAAGLLLAAAAAADGALARRRRGRGAARAATRSVPLAVLALVACTAPAFAAGWWLVTGISGPIGPASGEVVPALVSNAAGTGRQLRTLVLASSGSHVSYLLLRGTSPEFSYPDVSQVPAAEAALGKAVAALVAPGGGQAANQSQLLAGFDIGFVLMRAPLDAGLVGVLDGVPGLTQVSMTPAFGLWRLTSLPSRVSVIGPNGSVVAIPSGPVGVPAATVPASGGTLLLAEPAGGWSAAVDGHGLTPVPSPAGSWAQAFRLPPGGGTLTISRNSLVHDLLMALEVAAFLVVAVLALPGIRTAAERDTEAAGVPAGTEDEEATREPAGVGSAAEPGGRRRGTPRGARSRARRAGRSGGRRAGAPEAGGSGTAAQPGAARRVAAATQAGRGGLAALAGRAGRGAARRHDGSAGSESGSGGRPEVAAAAGPASSPMASSATEVFAASGGAGGPAEPRESAARRSPIRGRLAGEGGAARAAGSGSEGIAGPGRAAGAATAGASWPSAAAWPAGQPASRFMDGPPGSPRRAADPRDPAGWRGSQAPSPSGTPFDEPDPSRDAVRGAGPPAARRRAPGERYQQAPYGRDGDERRADYTGSDRAGSGYPGPASGYLNRAGYSSPSGYAGDDYGRGPGYAREPAARDAPETPASWDTDGQASGWPAGPRRGWPPDYGQSAESWPDHDQDDLGALPPTGEVHHDWSRRRDRGGRAGRSGRSWPAPEQDGDGEQW